MNKFGLFVAIAAICSFSSVSTENCNVQASEAMKGIEFVTMQKRCTDATKTQIKMEISASVKYMKLATHFAQDTINRPGFAKFFYAAASEEREHAYKLIEYLSMRGKYQDGDDVLGDFKIDELVKAGLTENVVTVKSGPNNSVQDYVSPKLESLTSGLAALKNALKLEVLVTESIRNLIKICETDKKDTNRTDFNHYHFVDYLTGEFLEEQLKGQRDLAGKISTLDKMQAQATSKELAEFLFDKQL